MQGKSSKRQKEQQRAQRHTEKAAKRAEQKRLKSERPPRDLTAEDPDIAGIVPGPQPQLET